MIIAILQKKETSAESQRFDKLTKGAKTPYQWRYLHHSWIPAGKFRMVPDLNISVHYSGGTVSDFHRSYRLSFHKHLNIIKLLCNYNIRKN